jgi:FAD dependent oxidoreductase TIGR03364
MQTHHADIAIVGAGILGLAHALAAAKRGYRVVVFERNHPAVGASVRNFGLVWPIGQPDGYLFERAMRSRRIWQDVIVGANLWQNPTGSLHLAYHADEERVLEEFIATHAGAQATDCRLLTPAELAMHSPAAKTEGLRTALYSPNEINIDPRQAIQTLPRYLEEIYGVTFRFGTPITAITLPTLETPDEQWNVERVFVCSGPEFELLYPSHFAASGITKCKLQMLRTVSQPYNWQLGASLCAGLTLIHYAAFAHCQSLAPLRSRVEETMPFYVKHGIHVLLSQTALGELTIGDHHEYGLTINPFDREEIYSAILTYLQTFAHIPDITISERWHGVYAPLPGKSEWIAHPEAGVTIVNGIGGVGMTLSFGLAEEIMDRENYAFIEQRGGVA